MNTKLMQHGGEPVLGRSFEHNGLKLLGSDVNLVHHMLDDLKMMLIRLSVADEVKLLSCPYNGGFKGPTVKAFEVKCQLEKPGVFVFDPNEEMEKFALSRFYDEEKQSKRWLEIWAEMATVVKEMREEPGNNSSFHFLCAEAPPAELNGEAQWQGWEQTGLKGNAQHGELRMACMCGAKGVASGLNFVQYDVDAEACSEVAQKEATLREHYRLDKAMLRLGTGRGEDFQVMKDFLSPGSYFKIFPIAVSDNFREFKALQNILFKLCRRTHRAA